jgi:hypothetical protein
LHGLGLNVYAGEDLPHSEPETQRQAVSAQPIGLIPAPFGKVSDALEQQKQQHAQNNAQSAELLTANQLRYIKKLIADTHTNEAQLLSFLGFIDLESIPKAEVNRVIRTLESHKQEAA